MSIEDKEQANGDFGDFGYRHHNQMYRIADDYSPEANGSCDPRIYNCDFEPGAYPASRIFITKCWLNDERHKQMYSVSHYWNVRACLSLKYWAEGNGPMRLKLSLLQFYFELYKKKRACQDKLTKRGLTTNKMIYVDAKSTINKNILNISSISRKR